MILTAAYNLHLAPFTQQLPDYTTESNASLTARQKTLEDYAMKRMSGDDIAFINYRGLQGAPLGPGDSATAMVFCLYGDPMEDPANAPAYYSSAMMLHNQTAIQSTEFMLQQRFLDEQTKATLTQALTQLRTVADTQAQRQQEQMTKLLENAKTLLAHREVDGEAPVAEAIDVIDAVLANIPQFTRPDSSEASAKFFELYSGEVKSQCELALGKARNSHPLFDTFMNTESLDPASLDQAWQRAMDTVRPQARAMAETLKTVLRPYSGLPPVNERGGNGAQGASQPAPRGGMWNLV